MSTTSSKDVLRMKRLVNRIRVKMTKQIKKMMLRKYPSVGMTKKTLRRLVEPLLTNTVKTPTTTDPGLTVKTLPTMESKIAMPFLMVKKPLVEKRTAPQQVPSHRSPNSMGRTETTSSSSTAGTNSSCAVRRVRSGALHPCTSAPPKTNS